MPFFIAPGWYSFSEHHLVSYLHDFCQIPSHILVIVDIPALPEVAVSGANHNVGLRVDGSPSAVAEPEVLLELGITGVVLFAVKHPTSGSKHGAGFVYLLSFEKLLLFKTFSNFVSYFR